MKAVKIEQKKIRRTYYAWSLTLIFIIAVFLSIPVYTSILEEYENTIEQLETSVINQKKVYLESVIIEKMNDVRLWRLELESLFPEWSEEQLDERFRADVRAMIHTTVLPDDGYIWINEVIDYNGGDNYAIRFAHPNLKDTEGDFLSTETTDKEGNKPYLAELEGIKAGGEVYLDYYFQKMDSDVETHKLSFMKLYPSEDWIFGTGVYLDDVDLLISGEVNKMKESTQKTVVRILTTIIMSMLVLFILIVLFERKIQTLIESYVMKVQDAYGRIEKMAYTDFLTGLLNRRAMLDDLEQEVSRMKRENKTFALLMCDIDFFKKVNDQYGHEAGDEVLKTIASLMEKTFRREDRLSRWGGEEFLCMVTSADKQEAWEAAEKLRKNVEKQEFQLKGDTLHLTLTVGVALFDPQISLKSLIDISDEKLYQGKRQGRNQSVI